MKYKIGIRDETKLQTERRVPLIPEHVKDLVDNHGVAVNVVPSAKRVFDNDSYREAGAAVDGDFRDCNIVFGVKEVPKRELVANTAFCFFSHTIKGQSYNMPLLQKILDLNITLLDYELVKDENGRRQIFFGNYAGYAGMIDSLWALGQRLQWEGMNTPFAEILPAYEYDDLAAAREAIQKVGDAIRKDGLPAALGGPFVCGFNGYGQVSKGAQDIFDHLPNKQISASELAGFMQAGVFENNTLYKVEFTEEDMFTSKSGANFDLQDYFKNPQNYNSRYEQYVPYLSMIINGIYWTPQCPVLLTRPFVRDLYGKSEQPRLRVIGDITCDIDGSLQTTVKSTDANSPIYVYDPRTGRTFDGHAGNGPVVMAVDILPAELPREASTFFGNCLLPFVPALAACDYTQPFEKLDLPPAFKQAVIAHAGELTPDFRYLQEFLDGEDGD